MLGSITAGAVWTAASTQDTAAVQTVSMAQTAASTQDTAAVQTVSMAQTAASTQGSAAVQTVSTVQTTATVQTDSAAAALLTATGDLFSDRDLTQTADLSEAISHVITDGETYTITEAGVYVLSGTAADATVMVDAGDEDKVQLVLDGLSISNEDFACIYVQNADKVFITSSSDSSLSVTGSFRTDGDTETDGVIFSRDDLVLNGTAVLTISSSDNGIVCKDDLKLTGGTYLITAASKAVEANDSILVYGGTFTLTAGTDGLHAENNDDNSTGYIYIAGGDFSIKAGDDGIHATTFVQIDDGELDITASEGIEATVVQINGGTINIAAGDDGINAGQKSSSYSARIEINGGNISVSVSAGDTDAIDSNGDIIINGGTVDVTGNSAFDCDGTATFNGGTVMVNGQEVNAITGQFGAGRGGMGGNGGMNGGFGGRRR